MPDPIIKQALKDFVATANSGKYSDEKTLFSKFPELKEYDVNSLKDFVATANSGKYNTEDEIFARFPEFESKKKVTPLQPSQSSAIPSLSQTIEKNRDITNQFQPQGENVNVQRNVFADYENVLNKRANLDKQYNKWDLQQIPIDKQEYDAEAKKLGDILIPSIKTGIKNLEGKFTTKNGELDYSAIGKASSMMSQQLGGGDYVKEQIRQQIINQEEYSKVKPAVNQFANQVWKKITGKTVDEFVGEKNQAVKDFILQKQVLEQNFQKTQVTLNKEYTAKSEQINEKYKAILSQAKSEEEQSQIASSYITEMNGLASQYNSRINRVKKEVDDELKSKISKAELSDETKKQLDIVYNEAYKYVTKANLDKKQKEQDELYGKNWYNQLLPYNPYTDWEKAKKTFFAPKFIALGWKSATGAMFNGVSNLGNGLVGLGLGGGFTDFLRGQQQRADRLETVDVELKGTNWLKPNTFATRLGKQIGFQAPIIAATAFTKNPFMAGTIGFGVEQVQNAGEVYNTMMQQYDDPIKAQNAAKNYLTKNLPTLPLYFLESEMMLRFAKAKPGVLKNVAAENLNEVTQELFQGYTQQQEYKNAKSLGTFLKEDAPNIALETALTTTLQSGLFAAGGKIMKKLGTDVEYAQKSHLYNLVSTKGLNAAFGVLELKANNNLISPEEMAAQKEKLTKLNNDIFTLKDNGLTDVQVGVYLGLTAKLDAIREKQAKSTNPQITQSYQKEIESIEKKIQDAVMGKLDGVSVTLPSGSTMTLEGNGEDILSELKDEIATGQADITSTDDKVNQKVEQLKQKSPPPVPDEALEQIQNEVGEIEDNFQQKGYSIDFVNDSVVISDLDGNIIGIEDIPADLQQQAVRYEDLAIPKLEEQKPTEVKAEVKAEPTKTLTNEEKVKQLRAEEQAEYDAMPNQKDEVKKKEIYDKYDKLITPLLEAENKEQTKEQPKQIKIAEDESENKYANDKLTEKDNIEQEPSIKAIESKAESNDKAELNEVVKQVDEKLNAATDVRVVPLSSITTDESRFQNRQELDQQKLNDIAENWKDADQDPIHVWTDPKNGKTYVLSGHHRFYGAKKAGRENVKIVDRTNDFTETQAIKFAKEEANANRTMETPLERAKALREKTKRGDSKQEINKFLEREGKNKSFVQNLAALNPLGKVMQMLGQFGNAEDRQTQKETEQRADWIGEARRTIAGLTDAHENEMFDFLFDKDASKRITTKADFLQKVRSVVKPLEPNVPLNIARFKNKTQGEAAYNEAVNEKKAEIAGKQEKINEINDRFSNPQNPNYISTENKEYASARSIADNKISQLESERKLLQKQLEDIYREKGKYTSAATSGSLFSATSPESTISKPSFDALIERISKAFPKVKFFYDEGTFNKKMKKYGNGNLMRTPSGTIYGATFPDGSVYINQKVLSAETPIHEASHIWEALFPKEWKNGVELFRQSKGFQKALQEVQSNKAYKNKTLQEQESEALNTLIGRKGEGYFQNELLSKFKAWLQKFFNYIGQKFGVKLSPDTKLNQFVNEVIGDILGGKELKGKLTSKDVKFQIIGENAELAQEVRDNLQVAREMEIEKKDAKTIRLATGWERGIDGKWRYEILDVELNSIVNLYDELTNERNDIIYNKAKGKSISELKKENSPIIKRFVELENKFNQLNTNKEIPLGQIVYGEVLKAYPKLKDIKVVLGADIGYGTKGIWVNSENTIYLSNGLNTLKDKSESYSILLHEIQHAIQDIEGFAKGGNEATILEELEPLKEKLIEINKLRDKWQNSKINSKEEKIALNNYNKALDNFDFAKFNRLKKYAPKQIGSVYSFEGYQALAGEAEARNVQKRLSMTAEQRKATPLQETEDIAREEQIILFETSKSLSRNKSIFEDYDKYNALKNSEKVKNPQIVEQLKSKYGQELNKVKDITLNFDKYITQLLNSGYIKDKIC